MLHTSYCFTLLWYQPPLSPVICTESLLIGVGQLYFSQGRGALLVALLQAVTHLALTLSYGLW